MNTKLQRLLYTYQQGEDDKAGAGGGADDGKGAAPPADGKAAPGGDQGKPAPPGDDGKAAKGGKSAAAGKAEGEEDDEGKDDNPWGSDWRVRMARGNEAVAKKLGRYADPTMVADSLAQLHDKIAKGELRSPMPKDATPEQLAKWRSENGLPDSPDKYSLGDRKIDEADRPTIDSFLKASHGAALNEKQVQQTVDWYYNEVARVTEERAAKDAKSARDTEDALRKDWGTTEYRGNINAVTNFINATMPADVRDLFMHGRLSDGTPIMAHPGAIKGLLAAALQVNPAITLDVPTGSGLEHGIESEIKAIEADMKKDSNAYFKDEKKQARYRDLLEGRDAVAKRGK